MIPAQPYSFETAMSALTEATGTLSTLDKPKPEDRLRVEHQVIRLHSCLNRWDKLP